MSLKERINLMLERSEKRDVENLVGKKAIKEILKKDDLTDDQFAKLFDYYLDTGEMPHGTAKARTGDPHEWITDRVKKTFGKK